MSTTPKIDDGGPAFPVPSVGTGDPRDGMTTGSDGMTLRDWFAGQAAAAMIGGSLSARISTSAGDAATLATASYRLADAMIRARQLPPT